MNEAPANHYKAEPDDGKVPTVDSSVAHIKNQFNSNPEGDACAAVSQLRDEMLRYSERKGLRKNELDSENYATAVMQKLETDKLLPALTIAAQRLKDETNHYLADPKNADPHKLAELKKLGENPAVQKIDAAVTKGVSAKGTTNDLLTDLSKKKNDYINAQTNSAKPSEETKGSSLNKSNDQAKSSKVDVPPPGQQTPSSTARLPEIYADVKVAAPAIQSTKFQKDPNHPLPQKTDGNVFQSSLQWVNEHRLEAAATTVALMGIAATRGRLLETLFPNSARTSGRLLLKGAIETAVTDTEEATTQKILQNGVEQKLLNPSFETSRIAPGERFTSNRYLLKATEPTPTYEQLQAQFSSPSFTSSSEATAAKEVRIVPYQAPVTAERVTLDPVNVPANQSVAGEIQLAETNVKPHPQVKPMITAPIVAERERPRQ